MPPHVMGNLPGDQENGAEVEPVEDTFCEAKN